MRIQYIMWGGLIFAIGTIISLTYGGVGLGDEEVAFINSITVFKQANILGVWSVPIPNITFFTTGAKALLNLDFAFFNDGMLILQWILYAVFALGLTWGFFVVVISVINSRFSRTG